MVLLLRRYRASCWIAAACASLCLLPVSASAYTVKVSSQGAAVRWASDVRTVELSLGPNVESMLQPGMTYAAAAIASEAWRGYDKVPRLSITESSAAPYDPDKRNNGIYLLDPWPFDDERLAVTVTSFLPTGQLVGVDVLINGEVSYAVLPEPAAEDGEVHRHDLPAVLTHEFGHVLGLDESMDDPAATMWPFVGPGEVHQRTLADDDESAVSELYSGHLSNPSGGCGTASVAATPPPRTPMAAVGAALALVMWRRRRLSA